MVSRDIMRSTTRHFKRYYNPEIGGEMRMDTNTNVLGSNPAAERYLKHIKEDLNDYPNTYSDGLRDALAGLYGLDRENFIVGSGSDELLDITFKTFTEWGDRCMVPVPSYSLYDYFVGVNGAMVLTSELTEDFQLDVDDLVSSDVRVTIVPSPNNPTGNSFSQKDLEELLERSEGVVVVDEAYGEYSDHSMIPHINDFDNLVVLRTFSKAYAMAALRVGYAIANECLAEMMNCIKIPYSLNKISEGAAIAAVEDQSFVKKSKEMVSAARPKLAKGLSDLGFLPYPSDSNFILAKCPEGSDHAAITAGMKERGVLIRDFGSKRRTENCIRTTVGTDDMNAVVLDKLAEVLGDVR